MHADKRPTLLDLQVLRWNDNGEEKQIRVHVQRYCNCNIPVSQIYLNVNASISNVLFLCICLLSLSWRL